MLAYWNAMEEYIQFQLEAFPVFFFSRENSQQQNS